MAQIFVSHSAQDSDFVNFFSKAFAGTKVESRFKELDRILDGHVSAQQIGQDIDNSKAVFVILSRNVQNLPHTRDWVVTEASIGRNRDVWIFEPLSQYGEISVIFPYLRHYVVFETDDDWFGYIRTIIESYEDSHSVPTWSVTGSLGALLDERNRIRGALVGAALGKLLLPEHTYSRSGITIICLNCRSSYDIHIPNGLRIIRCPVCNNLIQIVLGPMPTTQSQFI